MGRTDLLNGFGFGAFFLTPALIATYFGLTEPEGLMASLTIGLVCYLLGGVFVYVLLTAPWHKEPEKIHHTSFSSGSIKKFQTYFEDKSQVGVASVNDICRWLQGCRYEQDQVLFDKNDVWQHPVEFEQRRQGDCEDHALWAWRKLTELGFEAEFVVGNWNDGGHAWVLFNQNGQTYLLESTSKTNDIVRPLQEAHSAYRPDYAVDRWFETYRYGVTTE